MEVTAVLDGRKESNMVAALKNEIAFQATESQLVAPQKDLKKQLQILNRFADRKSTMPILGTILMRTSCKVTVGEVLLTATDLNNWITLRAPDWGRGNGQACVKAKQLLDVVGKLGKDSSVTLAPNGVNTSVLSGAASLTVEGYAARDYPKIPEPKEPTWTTIDAGALKALFESTDYSTCRDETRFHLAGTFVEANGKTVRAVSTDGHRLTRATTQIKGWTMPKGVIVPRKACVEIAKLLTKGECEIYVGKSTTGIERMLFVRQGGWTLASKTIDADFPPYEQVIPRDEPRLDDDGKPVSPRKLVTVDRAALLAALERAALICSDVRGVKLSCADGQLKLSADNADGGTSNEWMPAEHHGGTVAVGFNPRYLIETIAELDGERVTISLRDELDPALIRGTDDVITNSLDESPYLGVVMPMRI